MSNTTTRRTRRPNDWITRKEFWLAGGLSAAAQKRLRASGWRVEEGVREALILR